MPVHYFEDPQGREWRLTLDLVRTHWQSVGEVLGLGPNHRVVIQMPKSMYGAKGDVDIAVWSQPNSTDEALIAVEVKTLHLTKDGKLKSQKPRKHLKQLLNLERDGWDYVWLFDVIVTEPVEGWWHPQAFEGFDKHAKVVGHENYGHVRFQINPVAGHPEADAGSISHEVLCNARKLEGTPGRTDVLGALRRIDFGHTQAIVGQTMKGQVFSL